MKTSENSQTAILILAGGRSSRMGEPKHGVILSDGRPMIEHVLDACRPLHLPIYLSAGDAQVASLEDLQFPILKDDKPFLGPLYAIANAFRMASMESLLVVCCDQRHLTSSVLRSLIEKPVAEKMRFYRSASEGFIFPFPGLFLRSFHESMEDALEAGEKSPRRWIENQDAEFTDANDDTQNLIRSSNTKESLN